MAMKHVRENQMKLNAESLGLTMTVYSLGNLSRYRFFRDGQEIHVARNEMLAKEFLTGYRLGRESK